MLTAEFCGAEFAWAEFAIDPRNYADIQSVEAPLGFVVEGRCALVVNLSGDAQIGANSAPKTQAVRGTGGVGEVTFSGLAAAGVYYDVIASTAAGFSSSGMASYIVPVEGTATLSFEGIGVPQGNGVEGVGTIQWVSVGRMGTTAGIEANGSLGFSGAATLQGVQWVTAAPSTMGFFAAARAQTLANLVASGEVRWQGTGRGSSFAQLAASAALNWFAVGRLRATRNSTGSSGVSFVGDGSMNTRQTSTSIGSASWTFDATGFVAAYVGATATGTTDFQSDGRVSTVASVVGLANFGFDGVAKPGGHLFQNLERSRARFDVPVKQPAFLVPQDAELGRV